MDWIAVFLGWMNTVLLGAVGIAVFFTRRWGHLRWFRIYLVAVVAMAIVYKLFFYRNVEFYMIKHYVGELLALAVVVEVLDKEADKRPFWPYLALFGLVVIPFLPIHPYATYYLPIGIFAFFLALELPTALRVKSAPLLAWSLISITTVVSDTLKAFRPWEEIYRILVFLDPWCYAGFTLILMAGIFWPELAKTWKWVARGIKIMPPAPAKLDAVTDPAGAQATAATIPERVVSMPSRGFVPPPRELEKEDESEHAPRSKEKIRAISDKIDALGAAVEAAAKLSVSLKKPFFSPEDLALYLGTDVETAKRFVEQRGIDKLYLTSDEQEWVVFHADVDSALGEE